MRSENIGAPTLANFRTLKNDHNEFNNKVEVAVTIPFNNETNKDITEEEIIKIIRSSFKYAVLRNMKITEQELIDVLPEKFI